MWEVSGSDSVVRVDVVVVTYEAMTSQCGRSVVHVLVVRVDIGVVIYEDMTPQCGRSVIQVLVVRVDIGVVTYEAMTSQCGRSVVHVLVVRIPVSYSANKPALFIHKGKVDLLSQLIGN